MKGYTPHNLYMPIDNLYGMARPGYRAHIPTGPCSEDVEAFEGEEISKTCNWLNENGLSLVVSINNRKFFSTHFERIRRNLTCDVLEIPCEDAFDGIDGVDPACFLTAEKLMTCRSAVLPLLHKGKKVAIHCGEGIGRTGSFMLDLMMKFKDYSLFEAIGVLYRAMSNSEVTFSGKPLTQDLLRRELGANEVERVIYETSSKDFK